MENLERITILLSMINRGRFREDTSRQVASLLSTYRNIIFAFGESDDSEALDGHSGRKVLHDAIILSGRNDLTLIEGSEYDIGLSFIISDEFKPEYVNWTWINEDDKEHPQGKSDKNKHYRASLLLNFIYDGKEQQINILTQHQSAFAHIISRFKQANSAMKKATILKDSGLTFLLRDQNTLFPGEIQLEKYLRNKHGYTDLTESIPITYDVSALETDSGGLNELFKNLFMSPFGKFLRKRFSLFQKFDSILISDEQKDMITYENVHVGLKGLDHDVLGISFYPTYK